MTEDKTVPFPPRPRERTSTPVCDGKRLVTSKAGMALTIGVEPDDGPGELVPFERPGHEKPAEDEPTDRD
jgi:hypothetical protein